MKHINTLTQIILLMAASTAAFAQQNDRYLQFRTNENNTGGYFNYILKAADVDSIVFYDPLPNKEDMTIFYQDDSATGQGIHSTNSSGFDSIVVLDNDFLLPPVNVSATAEGNFARIEWEDANPLFGYYTYRIYQSTDNNHYSLVGGVTPPNIWPRPTTISFINKKTHQGLNYYKVSKAVGYYYDNINTYEGALSEATSPVSFADSYISPYDEYGNELWTAYQSEYGNHGDPWMGDMTNSTNFNLMFADNASPDHVGDEVWSSVLFMNNSIPGWGDILSSQLPIYITIDLGIEVTLTQMLFKCRERLPLGTSRYMVDFDVWGSMNPKTDNDFKVGGKIDTVASLAYWTGWQEVLVQPYNGNGVSHTINGNDGWTQDGTWTKLHSQPRLYSVLPSGIKYHSEWSGSYLSAEDQQAILDGFSFTFDQQTKIRYLRFRIFDTSSEDGRNEWQYLHLRGKYN